MKTRNLVCSAAIVAISALLLGRANAQAQTAKVLPGDSKDMIKVMYTGQPNGVVTIRFREPNGSTIFSDKIDAKKFDKGFLKKYKVDREQGDVMWVEVSDKAMFVRYKVVSTGPNEWLALLQKENSNEAVIVSNKPNQ